LHNEVQRVVVVTGAASGIGRAVCLRLVAAGTSVVAVDINSTGGRLTESQASESGACQFVYCDIRDEAAIEAVVHAAHERGPIWGLVNCAFQQAPPTAPEDVSLDAWNDCFATCVTGTLLMCRAVFPDMKLRGGRIVNFGSSSGERPRAGSGRIAYGVSKGAVRTLTRWLATEWGQYRITVNTVIPMAATAAYETWFADRPEDEQTILDQSAIKRRGDPARDVAPLVTYLLSDEAEWTTGTTIAADGGRLMI